MNALELFCFLLFIHSFMLSLFRVLIFILINSSEKSGEWRRFRIRIMDVLAAIGQLRLDE